MLRQPNTLPHFPSCSTCLQVSPSNLAPRPSAAAGSTRSSVSAVQPPSTRTSGAGAGISVPALPATPAHAAAVASPTSPGEADQKQHGHTWKSPRGPKLGNLVNDQEENQQQSHIGGDGMVTVQV